MDYLLTIIIVYGLGVVFAGMGYGLTKRTSLSVLPTELRWIISYYVGTSVFLAVWRIMAALIGVHYSLYLVLFAATLIALSSWYWSSEKKLASRAILLSIVLLVVIQVFVFWFWTRAIVDNAYATAGSGHSPRYGNIALYMLQYDRLPIIGQNYAQSMLASITGAFGFNGPLFALNIWLGLNVFVMCLLSFYGLRYARVTLLGSALGTFLVMMGNTGISVHHVMVIDSGSPFAVNGYTDSLLSIGGLFAALLLSKSLWDKSLKLQDSFAAILLIFFIFVSWSMLGIQNYYLYAVAFAYLSLLAWRNVLHNRASLIALVLLGIVSLVIGREMGGMLVAKASIEAVPFGGMQVVERDHVEPIKVDIGVPMVVGSFLDWEPGINASDKPRIRIIKSVRSIFWPLAGFAIAYFLAWKKDDVVHRAVLGSAMAIFVAGAVITFPFDLFGAKWEVSRFMMVGYYAGLLLLAAGVARLVARYLSKRVWMEVVAMGGIAALTCWGPVHSIGASMKNYPDWSVKQSYIKAVLDFKQMIK